MRTFIAIAASFFILTACEETIKLDLKQSEPKIVIEGLVTDVDGYQSVKITKSAPFYTGGPTPRITDAIVYVTDSDGQEIAFVHNPNSHADSSGIYVPAVPFVGVVGKSYTLHVEAEGKTYEAFDQLEPVIPMDSLKYKVDEDEKDDPEIAGKYYSVLMFAQEPQDQTNYYLFKFFRNDSLTYQNDTDIYFSDDKLLGESISGIESPIYYGINDKSRVEMFSLTRKGFVYFSDLSSLLNNDGGGMFGSIPAPPRTNISNGGLGFFQVSSLKMAEIILEE